jgi:hypothetical protein
MVLADSLRLCGTLEIRLAPWVGMDLDAVLAAHALRPMLRQFFAAASGEMEAGSPPYSVPTSNPEA